MVALAPLLTGPAALGVLSVAVAALLGVLAWRSLDPETKPADPPAVAGAQVPGGAQSQQPAGAAAVPAAAPTRDAGAKGQQAAQAPVEPPKPVTPAAPQAPEFDLVRVEPTGEAVIAGRAAPGASVQLRSGGAVLGQALADANGQFVILPKDLPPGDHLLTLESAPAPGGEGVASKQTVSVRLPPPGKGEIVVALTAPDQPTKILSDGLKPTLAPTLAPERKAETPAPQQEARATPQADAAALAGPAEIVIRSVEAEEGGAFFASGAATAGADVRLYLNGSFVAEVRPGADGHWSLRIEKGMVPGQYAVRADLSAPGSSKVAARAEVPFVYEAGPKQVVATPGTPLVPVGGQADALPPVTAQNGAGGEPAKQDASRPDVSKPDVGKADAAKADAVVSQIQTATVVRGDSLWRISRQVYGHGLRYTQIYRANESQIRDPELIYPGQVLVVPKEPGKAQ